MDVIVNDPRVRRLAEVLVHHSLATKPGDRILIHAPATAAPLVREVYRHAIDAGAHPTARITLAGLTEIIGRDGTDEQIQSISDLDRNEIDHVDSCLVIAAEENTKELSGIAPQRRAALGHARALLMRRCVERIAKGDMRWCRTLFPTNAHAQDAGMSLNEYEDFVFRACLLGNDDPIVAWRQLHQSQQTIADFLETCDCIQIEAPGVDITYSVRDRSWTNGSGAFNIPDGEVFSGPIENSVNGTIRFTYPAVYGGVRVEDVALQFQDGRVIEASASRNEEFLLSVIDTDEGARYVGEVAFGLNDAVDRFTGNTLFDEKIAGTMHLALGSSYPNTGGVNHSAIHWDMVTDLREGKVYADGDLCYDRGDFLHRAGSWRHPNDRQHATRV
jgi:aminopeptidase